MKLTKEHRQSLINKLSESSELRADIKTSLNYTLSNPDKSELIHCYEIDLFLIQKQIELIENSLIDNDIDF